MNIVIHPDRELEFKRPFTSVLKQTLTVSNKGLGPIAFKVKTTSPKQYCVRPNAGKLAPGASIDVTVLLQSMREDPPLDFKCKDKFLIQVIPIPEAVFKLEGDAINSPLNDLWNQAETLRKSDVEAVTEKKLKVVFLPKIGETLLNPGDLQPTRDSRSDTANSSATRPDFKDAPMAFHEAEPKEMVELKEKVRTLQDACTGYKVEIDRINALRQRRANESSSPSKLASPQRGVSLAVVAFVALIAFILGAYLL